MKILLAHNYYLQPGGEDVAFRTEIELLQEHGHTVQVYEEHNSRIDQLNPVSVAIETIWSESSRQKLIAILNQFRPDVVHFQNTFPLISPSAYYACRRVNASVVQTLQNYRLLCPAATLYRDGHICEECLGKPVTLPGIVHACYHSSYIHSGALTAMLTAHRVIGTWQNRVDAYIALTEFAREKFIEGGLPANKIYLKPNVTSFRPSQKQGHGEFALFAGRLTEEKGLRTLLSAWRLLNYPLKIAGDGPLSNYVLQELEKNEHKSVQYLGRLSHQEVSTLMKNARVLIFPSEWYEGFPLTIAESLACGLPIIASDIGSQAEIIQDGYSGLHFRAGDEGDLREKVQWVFQNPADVLRMSENALYVYQEKYTPEKNYEELINIYSRALENRELGKTLGD
jgi:glycosyltransferase involved in cell wall biosynthesis